MEKLNLTEQQGEQIAALREEGLALRLEVEARRIAWEAAEQIEALASRFRERENVKAALNRIARRQGKQAAEQHLRLLAITEFFQTMA